MTEVVAHDAALSDAEISDHVDALIGAGCDTTASARLLAVANRSRIGALAAVALGRI
jgi:hypothetical protein